MTEAWQASKEGFNGEQTIRVIRFQSLILLFSLLFAFFFIAPALLSAPFEPFPLMSWGDVVDIFTPFILLPLYWVLYLLDRSTKLSVAEGVTFIAVAALWAEGQGMHLAANSIGHLVALTEGDLFDLTQAFDERLSHYLWHFGIIGLSALLVIREWRNPLEQRGLVIWKLVLSGLIYGFAYFLIIIEGDTAPLGVPFALLVTLSLLIWARKSLAHQPLTAFFFIGSLVAVVLFLIWGLYWGGLPEFSEVGLL